MYGKTMEVEQALGELESQAAILIRAMMASGPPDLFTRELAIACLFISFQWARTPVAIARENAMSTAMLRQVARAHPNTPERIRPSIDEVRVESTG
jgi:hypothetical protein